MDDRLIFTVWPTEFRWSDVVRAGKQWGLWDQIEREAAEGIACVRMMESLGLSIPSDELEGFAADFRYRRDLLAGDELTRWLEDRELEVEDWTRYIARSLARQRFARELDDLVLRDQPSPEEIAAL